MLPPLPDALRRLLRWLAPAALLALVPKCLLCVAAYAGIGTALGLGGPEICGAPAGGAAPWLSWLPLLGAACGIGGTLACARNHAKRLRAERRCKTA